MKDIILVLAPTKTRQIEAIKNIATDYEVLLQDELEEADAERVRIIYGWNNSDDFKALAATFLNLKWVQATSAGVDYIPNQIKTSNDIYVTNASGIHAIPISETVFAYILASNRNLFYSQIAQTKNEWDKPDPASFKSLTGKTILVYGAGNIGEEIARLAKAFRMNTIGVNTSGKEREHFDQMFALEKSQGAISQADYIVNALPATQLTNDLFDQSFFNEMKESALFINIGRGQAVDEEALKKALEEDQIAGAYLDVFKTEPLPADSPLWQLNNLLISPHITGVVEHFRDELFPIFEENLVHFMQHNEPIRNIVESDKGY